MVIVFIGIVALLVIFAVCSFFLRRHAESDHPDPGWSRTDEVFRDPSTARLMRVWVDAQGHRHYVSEGRLDPEP
jgi:hypothetical protein